MSQGPLCPNLSQKVQAEVSQMANRNLSRVILLGGLSVNLNHLKILKAECLIDEILANKRMTVHKLQSLCGFLNFLGRSVVPGKAFTRHIYSAFSGKGPTKLKQHHHIRISGKLKSDLFMWQKFIRHPAVFSRKFINCTPHFATELEFFY